MRPTTFIMGAGVSIPFGFPSGDELLDSVTLVALNYPKKSHGSAISRLIDKALPGTNPDSVLHFGKSLLLGAPRSIDHFVEVNPRFADIAKIILAVKMIETERECINNVFRTHRPYTNEENLKGKTGTVYVPNALRYVFHKIAQSKDFDDELAKHNFITFNYDRTLEHYMYNMFLYGRQRSPDKAAMAIAAASEHQILHVHGSLGPYRPDDISEIRATASSAYDHDRIKTAIQTLSFIDRSSSDKRKDLVERMSSLFRCTERVVVLGFGYETANMSLLRSAYGKSTGREMDAARLSTDIKTNWFGSALGKLNEERKEIDRYLPMQENDRTAGGKYISRRGEPDLNDLDFMRKWVNMQAETPSTEYQI